MIVSEAKYLSRFALVLTKQAIGVRVSGDKTFFIDRFARLCRAGRIGPDCKVLALGKGDGAGSQALTSISAMNFAAAHGLTYVHRPFTEIEHAEAGISNWTNLWEQYFNLGEGELQLNSCSAPIVPIANFLNNPKLWHQDVIVSAEHFLHYQKLVPDSWLAIRNRLWDKYRNYQEEPNEVLQICVHVRRGDVFAKSKKTSGAFTSDDFFLTIVRRIADELGETRVPYALHVHSQGSMEDFATYAAHGCELHLDEPALLTHTELVNADVLVTSKSSFSYTAALLNRGIVLYQAQKHPPLSDWIALDELGGFDTGALLRALVTRQAGRRDRSSPS